MLNFSIFAENEGVLRMAVFSLILTKCQQNILSGQVFCYEVRLLWITSVLHIGTPNQQYGIIGLFRAV